MTTQLSVFSRACDPLTPAKVMDVTSNRNAFPLGGNNIRRFNRSCQRLGYFRQNFRSFTSGAELSNINLITCIGFAPMTVGFQNRCSTTELTYMFFNITGKNVSAQLLRNLTLRIQHIPCLYLSASTIFQESSLMDQTFQIGY